MPEPRTARAEYGGKAPRCLEPRTKAASPVGRSVRWPFKSVASLIPILAPNLENQLAMVQSDFARRKMPRCRTKSFPPNILECVCVNR